MIHTDRIVLRKEDEDECALGGMTPLQAVMQSVEGSTRSWAISHGGEVLVYWGFRANSIISGGCRAWMLSTPAIEKHRIFAARKSQALLGLLLEDFAFITVVVDPRYALAIRWLEWLGFVRSGFWEHFFEMTIERGGRA